VALWLGWREVRLYRMRHLGDSDVFLYTGRRLAFRALGLIALAAFAITLALFESQPPRTPAASSTYLGMFVVEFTALIIAPIADMMETRQTSAGGKRRPLPTKTKKAADK